MLGTWGKRAKTLNLRSKCAYFRLQRPPGQHLQGVSNQWKVSLSFRWHLLDISFLLRSVVHFSDSSTPSWDKPKFYSWEFASLTLKERPRTPSRLRSIVIASLAARPEIPRKVIAQTYSLDDFLCFFVPIILHLLAIPFRLVSAHCVGYMLGLHSMRWTHPVRVLWRHILGWAYSIMRINQP